MFSVQSLNMLAGSTCDTHRFRGSDGAFYDGVAAGAEGAHVLLRFARPTKPYQLAAARVPTAALLPAQPAPDLASQLAPGASVVVLSGWGARQARVGLPWFWLAGSGADGILHAGCGFLHLSAMNSPLPDMLGVLGPSSLGCVGHCCLLFLLQSVTKLGVGYIGAKAWHTHAPTPPP